MLFNALQLACMTSVLTYYAKYILFDETQVTAIYLVFAAGNLLGLAFAAPLGKKYSKRPLMSTLLGIQMVAWIGCWFAFDNIYLLYASVAIMALAGGMTNPNVYAILSESVDYGEYMTLILAIGKYDNTAAVQSESAVFAIRFSLSGICFICAAVGFIGMMFYPVTREKMQEIVKTLKVRREKENSNEFN